MKKLYILLILAAFTCYKAQAQHDNPSADTLGNAISKQTTGNSNDILTNLLRAGISNLLGKGTSFELHTTLYGIDSAFNRHNRSNVDTLYLKQRTERNIQIDLSIKADSATNQITTFSGGVTIALINKRNLRYADFSSIKPLFRQYGNLRESLNQHLSLNQPDSVIKRLQASWTKYAVTHNYNDLDTLIKTALAKKSHEDQDLIISNQKNIHAAYTHLAAQYAEKPLLTVAPNYSYNRISKQSTFKVTASFLDGIGNTDDGKEWEFQANSSFSIQGDSTISGPNFKSRPFNLSSGVNKVLAFNADKVSTCELKGYFAYTDQFGDVPTGEEKTMVTFNTTVRVKLFNSVWVPLTLSYDIKHPNLLGFLSFTANID